MKTIKLMLAGAAVVGFTALTAQAEETEGMAPAPEAVIEAPAAPHMEKCGECGQPKLPANIERCKECGRPKFPRQGMRNGKRGERGPHPEFKEGGRKQNERPNLKRGKRPVRMHKGEMPPPPPPAPEAPAEEASLD